MTKSVPEHASFENFRKQAKSLRNEHAQQSPEAARRIRNSDRTLASLTDNAILERPLSLAKAQFIVAGEYGFSSWTELKRHLERMSGARTVGHQFVQAIGGGSVEAVRRLFEAYPEERGRLVEATDEHGRTILQLATLRSRSRGYSPNVELLLENGARMDLWSACGLGDLAAIDALLKKDPEALHHTVYDVFPIQYAIVTDRPEAVRHLLKRGEDPNRPLRKAHWFVWDEAFVEHGLGRWTPLLMAGIWGRLEIFDILLEAGADLTATSTLGNRSIHWAAVQNRIPLLQRNLDAGVDIDLPSSFDPEENALYLKAATDGARATADGSGSLKFKSDGCSPLLHATLEGNMEAIEWLVGKGADITTRNAHGATILHLAAAPRQGENVDILQAILELAPANGNSVDLEGNTPMDYAIKAGNNRSAEILNHRLH